MNPQALTPLPGRPLVYRPHLAGRPHLQRADDLYWSTLASAFREAGFRYVSPDEYGLLVARPGLHEPYEGKPHYAIHYTVDETGYAAVTFKIIGCPGYGEREYALEDLLRLLEVTPALLARLTRLTPPLCQALRRAPGHVIGPDGEERLLLPCAQTNDPGALTERVAGS